MESTSPDASGGLAVEVKRLSVTYGNLRAVDDLSLEARFGEVLTLLGPNGAGKTTTIEALEGYRRPASGDVKVLGMSPLADRRALSSMVGVMLQQGGVYPAMNAKEALTLFASYYDEAADVPRLIETLRLDHVSHTPWKRLSGGEQQRLSLALALVGDPQVIFLDEPTAGVDPEGRISVRSALNDMRAAGKCIIMTTHELAEAEHLSDRIVIMNHGRKVASGSPAEVRSLGDATGNSAGGVRFHASGVLNLDELAGLLESPITELGARGEYLIEGAATPAMIVRLASHLEERGLLLIELAPARKTLEDAYLQITSGTDDPLAANEGDRKRGARQGGGRR